MRRMNDKAAQAGQAQATITAQPGLTERMLRELIRSPKFKSSLRIMVNGIDPAHAPGMVRALLWEDVETFMGTTSVLPKLVNFTIQALRELAVQLNSFPPEILLAFLSRLAKEIDFATAGEALREFSLLLEKLGPVVEVLRESSQQVFDEALRGRAAE
ncbi:MAG: hypothetical protein H5T73_11205 [Actinobacteria bacterium]|nr:hypothetical protein [Actinomycetota bacterium]